MNMYFPLMFYHFNIVTTHNLETKVTFTGSAKNKSFAGTSWDDKLGSMITDLLGFPRHRKRRLVVCKVCLFALNTLVNSCG